MMGGAVVQRTPFHTYPELPFEMGLPSAHNWVNDEPPIARKVPVVAVLTLAQVPFVFDR
jgi:hypothetical protein